MRTKMTLAAVVVLTLLAGCGDSDDEGASATDDAVESADAGSAGTENADTGDQSGSENEADGPDGDVTAGGSGSLVLDGQSIELTEVRCHLEPQDAAAGGGQILFVGQGHGVDADGQQVLLDVSRYDEDSQFEGDSVTIDIGDIMSDDSINLSSSTPIGTVTVDGGTMRADDLVFEDYEQGGQRTASFELTC